jgi:hypothetical protein
VDDLYAVLDDEAASATFRVVRATDELTVEVRFD